MQLIFMKDSLNLNYSFQSIHLKALICLVTQVTVYKWVIESLTQVIKKNWVIVLLLLLNYELLHQSLILEQWLA